MCVGEHSRPQARIKTYLILCIMGGDGTLGPAHTATLSPERVLAAYDASGEYLEAQEKLSVYLKRAFLLVSRARMRPTSGGVLESGFIREDIGAARRVHGERLVYAKGGSHPSDVGGVDPPPTRMEDLLVILAGALPSSEVREAQKDFVKALDCVMDLAVAAKAIWRTQTCDTDEKHDEV